MLGDEELWDANAAGVIAYQGAHRGLQYAAEGEALAGLRAVEAAVRADQIEKDAAIARGVVQNYTPTDCAGPCCQPDTAIRAQLTEGNGDE